MSLHVYNSLTRRKEELVPLTPGQIGMYVCGVTVYDQAHIGHARSALVFDVIRRYLAFRGYRVRFVKNFTDVEDKIIARAAETGEDWRSLTERYIRAYQEDMAWLGVAPPERPEYAPRATEHIPEMLALIERLLTAGMAYTVDGDVYFAVRRFPRYGRLSGRELEDLQSGARVEVDERKRDPLDFALWKASKPGEPWWESPWGRGRPGWHIECSAMSMKYLGETFDVHGGGQDLIFPHHENEIAQSEAATDQPFVRYWIHNGFVNIDSAKMSKSLGNMLNVKDLREGTPTHAGGFHREAVRLYLLGTHYRAPLDFWEPRIDESSRALGRMRGVIGRAFKRAGESGIPGEALNWQDLHADAVESLLGPVGGDELRDNISAAYAEFTAAMDDDFNTPEALGALFELAHALNSYAERGLEGKRFERWRHGVAVLLALGRVLGLFWWQVNPYEMTPENQREFEALAAQREDARRRRDWARADAIRDALAAQGVRIEDTPQGWRLRWAREPAGH